MGCTDFQCRTSDKSIQKVFVVCFIASAPSLLVVLFAVSPMQFSVPLHHQNNSSHFAFLLRQSNPCMRYMLKFPRISLVSLCIASLCESFLFFLGAIPVVLSQSKCIYRIFALCFDVLIRLFIFR
eukprot:41373_1